MIIYVHYNNHKAYEAVNWNVEIQVDNVWVPAVLYKSLEDPSKSFVRSVEEFDEKFIRVELPYKLQDQSHIR